MVYETNNSGKGWDKNCAKKVEPRAEGGTKETHDGINGAYIVERNGFGDVVRVTKK